jgi:hypothetical protein
LLNDVLKIMIPRKSLILFVAVGFLLSLACLAFAQRPPEPTLRRLPFVSTIFGDDMVLQRDKKNTIWGWSDPGDKVQVEIAGKHASGAAGPDGRWQVKMQPPPVGGPYSIRISGHQTVELHNVLVGDVWLCGGQSNMPVAGSGLATKCMTLERQTEMCTCSPPTEKLIPSVAAATSPEAAAAFPKAAPEHPVDTPADNRSPSGESFGY